MNYQNIGKFISEMRKEKNLTQEELAEKLGITSKAVSKWECGKCLPDVSLYNELCTILDINVIELLKGEKIPKEDIEEKTNKIIYAIFGSINLDIKHITRVFNGFLIVTFILAFIGINLSKSIWVAIIMVIFNSVCVVLDMLYYFLAKQMSEAIDKIKKIK